MNLRIVEYTSDLEPLWDEFVINQSQNGTFLQTRRFLNYHGKRFKDCSILMYKGENAIVAVVPACEIYRDNTKVFSSHCGSTFGGIVISKQFYNIDHMEAVLNLLEEYSKDRQFDEIQVKCTPSIFCHGNIELLNYYLYHNDYREVEELSCVINFDNYKDDITSNFTPTTRRGYNRALKNKLIFKKIESDEEIADFYKVLCNNLEKYNTKPVHTLEELLDFKKYRLKQEVEFYGVYYEEILIAGSMVFVFENRVFHTQYLAASQEYLNLYPMNYLDKNLIETAKKRGFCYFSFGISTEQKGKILNKSLARFKETFGTEFTINRTFEKIL